MCVSVCDEGWGSVWRGGWSGGVSMCVCMHPCINDDVVCLSHSRANSYLHAFVQSKLQCTTTTISPKVILITKLTLS